MASTADPVSHYGDPNEVGTSASARLGDVSSELPAGKFGKIVSDLGKRLSRRQERDELLQKNILREDEAATASTLHAAKIALEQSKQKDTLNRRILNRPSRVDLKMRNILRVDETDRSGSGTGSEGDDSLSELSVSAATAPVPITDRQEALKGILKKRPERQELVELNILKRADVDPSLAATQQALRRAQLTNALEGQLKNRPDVAELEDRKILQFEETVEVLPTFRKSEYNRKPDNDATFRKLTPQLKVAIREELNSYKKHEMPVHEKSARNTCFH